MIKKITSFSNPAIKKVLKLQKSKERKSQKLFLLEGLRETLQALKAGIAIESVYVCPQKLSSEMKKVYTQIENLNCFQYEINSALYEKISYGEKKEGLVLIAQTPSLSFALPEKPESGGRWLVLEALEKPGNIGAVLRTCDGAGISGIILCEANTDLFHPNILRSSQGSVFYLPIFLADSETTLQWLKKNKLKVGTLTPAGSQSIYQTDLTQNIAFVFGSEHQGVSPLWIEHADVLLNIPMQGHLDSLNVSVSTAITLYESYRQKLSL